MQKKLYFVTLKKKKSVLVWTTITKYLDREAKTTETYVVTILEARSSNSRC